MSRREYDHYCYHEDELKQALAAYARQLAALDGRLQTRAAQAEVEEVRGMLGKCVMREESRELGERMRHGAQMDALRNTQEVS